MATTTSELGDHPIPPVGWLTAVPPTAACKSDPQGWYQHALAVDTANAGTHVLRLAVANLSPAEREAVRALSPIPPVEVGARAALALAADQDPSEAITWSVIAKADEQVVSSAGILYRVIQVGDLRVAVGGMSGVMTLPEWRGRGYARAVVASVAAFVGVMLWAPFVLAICPPQSAAFYERIGWRTVDAPIWCEQPTGRRQLVHLVAVVLPSQGAAVWPSGPIDLCGAPW